MIYFPVSVYPTWQPSLELCQAKKALVVPETQHRSPGAFSVLRMSLKIITCQWFILFCLYQYEKCPKVSVSSIYSQW